MTEEFSGLVQEHESGILLDLGCGFGNYLHYLSNMGFFVIGSDISTVAIKVANNRIKKQSLHNIQLILHDMRNLPFRDGSFNGIISINAVYHATQSDIKKVVREIHRVLREDAFGLVTLISDTDFKFDRTKITGEKTLLAESEAETGVVHSFFNREDIFALLKDFKIYNIDKEDRHIGDQLSSHWFVLFIKESVRS